MGVEDSRLIINLPREFNTALFFNPPPQVLALIGHMVDVPYVTLLTDWNASRKERFECLPEYVLPSRVDEISFEVRLVRCTLRLLVFFQFSILSLYFLHQISKKTPRLGTTPDKLVGSPLARLSAYLRRQDQRLRDR